ncbi:VWA domain-containing protein [Sulfidibacter corallicola]|uniref:VWA domain-containing protein n=1 Tax=Sulfidibacter corallicola TaxID=2818388 RepID=A0A8A4TGN7_SULCO|nr:VWA domain-containing protein [Sulfidibacter corallicola]QTD49086.1 VWA domain-containing protein [Sulfidibacter corallicola]
MLRRILFLLCLCQALYGQVSIECPETIAAGAKMTVAWTMGENEKDFITIVAKDTPEGKYKKYKYARQKSWTVAAPEVPGQYEVRFLAADHPYPTLVKKSFEVTAVTATVKVPATVPAGSRFDVNWTGPGNQRDFITIVAADAPERKYGKYVRTKKGNPLELPAPDEPGDYEVRYLTGQKYFTLASAPVKVTPVSATVTAPSSVAAGKTFEISWTGPDNPRDFVTIVEAGAKERTYGSYVYTRKGSTFTMTAPEVAGDYEVRYLTGGRYYTLATTPLTVTAVSAELKAAPSAKAGGWLSVDWTGPNNPRDFVTIVEAGAKARKYGTWVYTRRGNPLRVRVPEEAGDYEIRYLTAKKYMTLASIPLKVEPVSASLQAPDRVEAGSSFDVTWEGPNNPRDFIGVVHKPEGRRAFAAYRYTNRGSPLTIRAPLEAGEYQLQYLTGRKYKPLASQLLVVTPTATPPGRLAIVLGKDTRSVPLPSESAVELILDASGSMLQRMDGKRRIDIAKQALVDLVTQTIPEGTPFALRVFGHQEADACRTDLEQALAPLNRSKTVARIKQIQAKNLAKTPIAESLSLVASDLAKVKGQRMVVLITDGEETCGGDPAATIQALKDGGIDVRVNIVGFAIEDEALKQAFALWADLGDGAYFDADNAAQLGESVTDAFQIPYDVLDATGEAVASGMVGAEPVEVPAGTYRVQTRETPPRVIERAIVEPDKTHTLTLK